MNKLQEIAELRRTAVAKAKLDWSDGRLRERLGRAPAPRGFREALRRPGLSVIAEVKRMAPSSGALRPDADAADVARTYAAAGASAISVLTEPVYFGGSLDDLASVRSAQPLPVLRKDFIVDPWQLEESRAAGADAVLLIVALLGDGLLDYLARAQALGLDCLVEVHDEAELRIALDAGADVLGINNRDLRTLAIDLGVAERLAPMVPDEVLLVAESGIENGADAARSAAAGAGAVLVGGALMRAADPAAKLREIAECRASRSVA